MTNEQRLGNAVGSQALMGGKQPVAQQDRSGKGMLSEPTGRLRPSEAILRYLPTVIGVQEAELRGTLNGLPRGEQHTSEPAGRQCLCKVTCAGDSERQTITECNPHDQERVLNRRKVLARAKGLGARSQRSSSTGSEQQERVCARVEAVHGHVARGLAVWRKRLEVSHC